MCSILGAYANRRPKTIEPLRTLTTNNRRELIGMAMQGASRAEKESLVRMALSKMEGKDREELIRTLDREIWREQKP